MPSQARRRPRHLTRRGNLARSTAAICSNWPEKSSTMFPPISSEHATSFIRSISRSRRMPCARAQPPRELRRDNSGSPRAPSTRCSSASPSTSPAAMSWRSPGSNSRCAVTSRTRNQNPTFRSGPASGCNDRAVRRFPCSQVACSQICRVCAIPRCPTTAAFSHGTACQVVVQSCFGARRAKGLDA